MMAAQKRPASCPLIRIEPSDWSLAMRTMHRPQRTALALLIAAIGAPSVAWAAPMSLSTEPAGTAYKAPIPNVILSVDTSGSMAWCDKNGAIDKTSKCSPTRIANVQAGLNAVLINSTKYDNQFRLAWQSFHCKDIPSTSGGCNNDNTMGKFSGTKKDTFKKWVNQLTANTSTPSQVLAWNAGKYLQAPSGPNNPWNATPGTADSAPLACRRAYHIFLTDGGWNFKYDDDYVSGTQFKSDMLLSTKVETTQGNKTTTETTNNPSPTTVQNYDGKNITALPTPAPKSDTHPESPYGIQAYSIASTNKLTQIYRDSYGTETRSISSSTTSGSGSNKKTITTTETYAYPTLADIAFFFWATDLQPGIPNEVIPKVRRTGDQAITGGGKSVTFNEYWNPKNDPAEWQHLVQYTIGYGTSAADLPKVTTTSPQWSGGTFDMYGDGFASLAVGNTKWDDVTSTNADSTNATYGYDKIRAQEMWHMAINSRGKFYPVSGGDLTDVFSDIFDDIINDTTAPISGFTSASGSVSRVGTYSYQTKYTAADDAKSNDNLWYGDVTSDAISTSGASTPNPDWGVKDGKGLSTADKLDDIDNGNLGTRLILTYDVYSSPKKAVSFEWANLTNSTTGATQRMWLNKGRVKQGTSAEIATAIKGDERGEDRLNFIRGDRSKEASKYSATNKTATFRNRKSRQGDIVNSAVWYVGPPASGYATKGYANFARAESGRLPMIYVGGNDGMLHGFSAKDGTEKIAYVPHGVVQSLHELTDPGYGHRYYVDGSPLSGDVNIGGTDTPNWRTYLVGTLGAGGRGFFVLDVTTPGPAGSPSSAPASNSNFTKSNAADLVVMDKTAVATKYALDALNPELNVDPNVDPDIGHIFNVPVVAESNQQLALQITRTNDGRWAFITGNGYNSDNEKPVLLIQYLDGTKSLKKIIPEPPPTTGNEKVDVVGDNGLSAPQFLDVNGDGIPDFVYAGDLKGNMWKFDISSADSQNWGVAFGGYPLFTAKDSGNGQPITAPPVFRPNRDVGGLMVAFGTGRNLTDGDRDDTSKQTVYSILDNTRYNISSNDGNKGKVVIAQSPVPSRVTGRGELQEQSVDNGNGTGTAGSGASRSYWTLTSTKVVYSCAGQTGCTESAIKKGWYMDLPVAGERVTGSFDFYDGGNLLEIISEKPASGNARASGEEVCAPQPQAAKPFRTLINISSGTPAQPPIMDVNSDGSYDQADMVNGKNYARVTASSKELRFTTKNQQIRKGNDGKEDRFAKLPELLLRPSWRQLK